MAKNKRGKILKPANLFGEGFDELELANLHLESQSGLNTIMLLYMAKQYNAQKSALSPDHPNLSPNEIDCLKAVPNGPSHR